MIQQKCHSRNQRGLSLVQVLVAVGLMGLVSLGVAQLAKRSSDIGVRTSSLADEADLESQVGNLFKKEKHCTASLINRVFRKVDINQPTTDPGLNFSIKRSNFNGSISTVISSGDKVGNLNINSIKLFMPNGPTGSNYPNSTSFQDEGIVRVSYSKRISGSQRSNRYIDINVELFMSSSGGNTTILGCGTASDSVVVDTIVSTSLSLSTYANSMDGVVNFICPGQKAMVGETSFHWNSTEDRRHRYYCKNVRKGTVNLNRRNCQWSGAINVMDGLVNYTCPNNAFITGVSSYHWNSTEDRIYQFYCCNFGTVKQRIELKNCSYPSSWANAWDGNVNYQCPSNRFKTGEYSVHDNHYEDRRYKFKCCEAEIVSPN